MVYSSHVTGIMVPSIDSLEVETLEEKTDGNGGKNQNKYGMSEWLLFNANSAICLLYHGENKLIFNEMMMMKSALY